MMYLFERKTAVWKCTTFFFPTYSVGISVGMSKMRKGTHFRRVNSCMSDPQQLEWWRRCRMLSGSWESSDLQGSSHQPGGCCFSSKLKPGCAHHSRERGQCRRQLRPERLTKTTLLGAARLPCYSHDRGPKAPSGFGCQGISLTLYQDHGVVSAPVLHPVLLIQPLGTPGQLVILSPQSRKPQRTQLLSLKVLWLICWKSLPLR